jgi:hypothetical protein
MITRIVLSLCLALGLCRSADAQTADQSNWFEPQAINLSTRYRFTETSSDQVTANQLQFKEAFRLRFHLDRHQRFTIDLGAFSGASFTSSWDATGIGTGEPAADLYIKQLYFSAVPVRGVEVQAGGLYLARGVSSEITSYDDDGYVTGERMTVRKPARLYFDEVSVTSAALDPALSPGALRRMAMLAHPNYRQVQAVKRAGSRLSVSADITDVEGTRTARGAVSVHFDAGAPISMVRYEQYRRVNHQPAWGWALSAERRLTGGLQLQGGYADVDAAYGGLNGDRFQQGRRVFAIVTVPIAGPLNAQMFATRALPGSFPVANRTRFDVLVSYDVLAAVRGRPKPSA